MVSIMGPICTIITFLQFNYKLLLGVMLSICVSAGLVVEGIIHYYDNDYAISSSIFAEVANFVDSVVLYGVLYWDLLQYWNSH